MAEDPHRRRVALELNALHWTGALGDSLEGATIGVGTPVHDLRGDVLFERLPLTSPVTAGHADVALDARMGALLLAVSPDVPWNEADILEKARSAANNLLAPDALSPDYTERFVAYSLPKIGVQFLLGGEEKVMVDIWSLRQVPPPRDRAPGERPQHFERWSYIGELSAEHEAARRADHEQRVNLNEQYPNREQIDIDTISRDQFAPIAGPGNGGLPPVAAAAIPQRNLHYSLDSASHATCYEKEIQQTEEWCVAASIVMLLDFYRYGYLQERVATDLGLGTVAVPVALPNAQFALVVGELQALTSGALQVAQTDLDPIDTDATWSLFQAQILENRPAISFINGHARTVAGFVDQNVQALVFRSLIVYDPYAPFGTAPTTEEVRFAIYQSAFTAEVRII